MNIPPGIIKRCIKGDRSAQERLYQLSFSYLMSIACRYRRNRDDAMEMVNQGFYKILVKLDDYNQDKSYSAWIGRIMTNVLIDDFRRNKKQDTTDVDLSQVADNESPVEINLYERNIEAEELNQMLLRLPDIRNKVFNLYAIDGYSHVEISEKLGIPIGTSKWHLAEARSELRQMILQRQKKSNSLKIG